MRKSRASTFPHLIERLDKSSDPIETGSEIAVEVIKGLQEVSHGIHLMWWGVRKRTSICCSDSRSQGEARRLIRPCRLPQWETPAGMNTRFQDTASAYRLHRAVTNEADAISAAIGQYVGDDLGLLRNRLRVLDAGTGDGRV